MGANLAAVVTEIRSYPVVFKHVQKLKVGDALMLQEDGLAADAADG